MGISRKASVDDHFRVADVLVACRLREDAGVSAAETDVEAGRDGFQSRLGFLRELLRTSVIFLMFAGVRAAGTILESNVKFVIAPAGALAAAAVDSPRAPTTPTPTAAATVVRRNWRRPVSAWGSTLGSGSSWGSLLDIPTR